MLIKLIKITLIALTSLIMLLVIALNVIDPNDYKDDIQNAVNKQTGRELIINGPLQFSLFDFPTIKLEEVSFSNPAWAQSPILASMSLMEADLGLWSLFNGNIEIRQLTLISPTLHLETNPSGVHSWVLPSSERSDDEVDEKTTSSMPMMSLDNIRVENAEISYHNAQTTQSHVLHLDSFRINQASPSRLKIIAEGSYQQEAFLLDITTAQLSDWIRDVDIPLNFKAELGAHTQLQMNGDVAKPISSPQLALFIDGTVQNLQSLSRVLGGELPPLPPISINSVLEANGEAATLKQLVLRLGEDEIQGEVSSNWSTTKPSIEARIGAEQFNLAALLASFSDSAESDSSSVATTTDSPPKAQSTSSETLPFELLNTVNAHVSVNIGELIAPELSLTNLQLRTDLKAGQLNIAPLSFGLAGGEIVSNLALNTHQTQPSLMAQLDITQAHLSALPLLNQYLAGGQTDLSLNLQTAGTTMSAIQNNMRASVSLTANETAISKAIHEEAPALASFQHADIQFSLINADKAVHIEKLHLDQAFIQALIDDTGNANWQLDHNTKSNDVAVETAQKAETSYQIKLNDILLNAAQIQYADEQNQQHHAVNIDTLNITGLDDKLAVSTTLNYQDTDVSLSGHTSHLADWLADETVMIDFNLTAAEQHIHLQGDVISPLSSQSFNLALDADLPQISALNSLVSTELPTFAPFTLSTQLSRSGASISAEKLALTHGKSDINGDISIDWSEDAPIINSSLTSSLIDLTELPDTSKEAQQATTSDKVFPATPLPFALLQRGQGEVKLNVEQLKTEAVQISNALVTAKLDKGHLIIKPLFASVADGQMTGQVSLEAHDGKGALDMDISLINLNPRNVTQLRDYVIEGANTNAHIKLKGDGQSVADIMASANGKITLQTQTGKLNVKGNLLTSDLFTALIPTGGKRESMTLACGVINYAIKDGQAIADKGIALVTGQMNIVGSSKINLKTEALAIHLKPRVKEGLGISVADLADLVSIGGTLKKPAMGADLMSTIQAGLKVQSAIATGGLSLLASGLLEKLTADTDPCATALGIKQAPAPDPLQDEVSSP